LKQIISYLIFISHHFISISENIDWLSQSIEELFDFYSNKEQFDDPSKALILENTLLIRLVIGLIQYITKQSLLLPKSMKDSPVIDIHPYKKLVIDSPPVIETYQQNKARNNQKFQQICDEHFRKTGRTLKPINNQTQRKLNYHGQCPACDAPSDYLYENNVSRGQMMCKVCKKTFTIHSAQLNTIRIACPYCDRSLEQVKEREGFFVYKCRHDSCSFYLNNLKSMTPQQRSEFKDKPWDFKVRFIFRAFDLQLPKLEEGVQEAIGSKVDLSRIQNPDHVLGLILTYYVNYGLSSRKTAAIMKDIHQVTVSHQTVLNYSQSVSKVVHPFVEDYPYELTDDLTGDETYVKVKGKNHYVFFISDKVKKIITSYQVFKHRDTIAAIKSIYLTLRKYPDGKIPESLKLIVDGNPIYQLAQHYFASKGIDFNLIQVIGLKNQTEDSRLYRPFKQVTERLNRTFKEDYLTMNGFKTLEDANSYTVLFTTAFNFLRPHMGLKYQVPVPIAEIEKCPHMPAKWLKIIEMSYAKAKAV
jgi:transposase-like protein/uncharacterized protein YbaR (Trm112 family)